MNAKGKIFIVAAMMVGLAGWMLSHHPAPSRVAKSQPQPETPVVETAKAPAVEPAAPAPQEVVEPSAPVREPVAKAKTQPQITLTQPQKAAKEPLHDPDARDALALVGTDPQAEQYWLDAIFDSNLPDKEREDLMEDLNEVGFLDPDNVTADDLPLIANRLRLIEQIEPQADPFMRIHLGEAYKDLGNMYAKAAGQ